MGLYKPMGTALTVNHADYAEERGFFEEGESYNQLGVKG